MQIQKKTRDAKHVLFKISSVLLMLTGFVANLIYPHAEKHATGQ